MGGFAYQPDSPREADHYLRLGMLLDAPRLTDWLAFYVEYAHAQDQVSGSPHPGEAVYAAATAYAGRAVFLVEFKDYQHYDPWHATVEVQSPLSQTLVYQQPPTLERVITQINNNTDIVGSRLRVDYRVADSLLLYGALEYAQSHPDPGVTDRVIDLYAGAEVRWNRGRSHWFQLVGYRREDDLTAESLEEQLVAVEWDFAQGLPRGLSLESQGQVWQRWKPLSNKTDWTEGNAYVSLKWTPRLIAAFGYEFITSDAEQANQHHFFNGSVQWNITPATSVRVFGGGQRPGLKCISGICREFPAFQGAKLELVVRL
jgi:hypothetical protein